MLDVEMIRRDFPILSRRVNGKPLVYLDNRASAQKPQVVIDAISTTYSQEYADVHRGLHTLDGFNLITVQGTTPDKAPIFSFSMQGAAHPHDISTILDKKGVAVRADQHCAGRLMAHLGLNATCRASFAVYNTSAEVDVLIDALELAHDLFA